MLHREGVRNQNKSSNPHTPMPLEQKLEDMQSLNAVPLCLDSTSCRLC